MPRDWSKKEGMKWHKVNDPRPRFEQRHPWHFTFENSDREKYAAGYDAIDWSKKGEKK